jgi:hypothetical protein
MATMSIRVDLSTLGDEMASRPFCYLLTVSDDGRPHAVAVTAELADGRLRADAGGRTRANATARPEVSLVFPPAQVDGYSLIVDGTADVDDTCVTVSPLRAVLHRPAPAPEPSDRGCGSDCVELTTD